MCPSQSHSAERINWRSISQSVSQVGMEQLIAHSWENFLSRRLTDSGATVTETDKFSMTPPPPLREGNRAKSTPIFQLVN